MAGPVRSSTNDNRLVQPPRPPNAWILYRSDKLRELPPTAPGVPRRAQAEVSKLISNMWKGESDDVRTQYERRADAKKAEHQAMYPGYRFQPMKKEEKDRLREEKRLEKERERAQSKRGRARTTPYPPGFVAPPMPYPLQYYPQEMHYGPAGPSPPISAASSPRDTGPYQESIHGLEDQSDPQRTDASPSIYPPPLSTTNLPSTSPSVSPSSPFSRAVPPPPQAPWPIPASAPMTPHRPHPGPSQWQQPYMPSSPVTPHSPRWMDYSNQASPQAQNFVTFNIPTPTPQNMAGWTPDGAAPDSSFAESIQALMSATGDPSIFQLSNFNSDDLLSHPEGELEVSMGNIPYSLDEYNQPTSPSMLSDYDFSSAMAGPSSQPMNPASQALSPTDTTDLSMFFSSDTLDQPSSSSPSSSNQHREFGSFGSSDGMFQYVNLDQATTMNEDVPPFGHSSPATASGSIVPPGGGGGGAYPSPASAVYGSMRRSGGSWKPTYPGGPETPIDSSPPRSWGVPAS